MRLISIVHEGVLQRRRAALGQEEQCELFAQGDNVIAVRDVHPLVNDAGPRTRALLRCRREALKDKVGIPKVNRVSEASLPEAACIGQETHT